MSELITSKISGVDSITGGYTSGFYTTANAAYTSANNAYNAANSVTAIAQYAANTANAASATQASVPSAYGQANAAFTQANTVLTVFNQANAAYTQANLVFGRSNTVYGQANTAYSVANAAFAKANTNAGSATGGSVQAGSVVLTSSSSGAQSITPSDWNQTVTLPDATTMTKGAISFTIGNAGTYTIKILNSSGSVLGFLAPYTTALIGLADNTTVAGTWVLHNTADIGISSSLSLTGYGGFSDSAPIQEFWTYALSSTKTLILLSFSESATPQLANYALVYDATTNTYGTPVAYTTSGPTSLCYWPKVKVINSTTALIAYGTASNLYVRVITISGTTLSFGTAASVGTGGATPLQWSTYSTVYCLAYYDTVNGMMLIGVNYSGTTVTLGTPAAMPANNTMLGIDSATSNYNILNATNCNVFVTYVQYPSVSTVLILPFTVNTSTLAITKGTIATQQFSGSGGSPALAAGYGNKYRILPSVTDTWVMVVLSDGSVSGQSAGYYAMAFTAGSNTITKGSIVSIAGATRPGIAVPLDTTVDFLPIYTDLARVSSTKFCLGFIDDAVTGTSASQNMFANIFTVSGTTITAGTACYIGNIYQTTTSIIQLGLISVEGNYVTFMCGNIKGVVDCSGSSPTVVSSQIVASMGFELAYLGFGTKSDGSSYQDSTRPNYISPQSENGGRHSLVFNNSKRTAVASAQLAATGTYGISGYVNLKGPLSPHIIGGFKAPQDPAVGSTSSGGVMVYSSALSNTEIWTMAMDNYNSNSFPVLVRYESCI